MKIVDCFPYFNEKELLELRINLLKNKVDKFIICEANHTHKGEPKSFNCKNTLSELGLLTDKIQVIELNVPGYLEEPNAWIRERAQRNAIANYIENGDVCYISDCDEIINPELIEYYVSIAIKYPNNILRVPLVFLHGRADLRVYSDNVTTIPWNVPFICTKNHLEVNTLSDIREAKSLETNTALDIYITENGIVENAGWHFSWMGNTERQKLKLNSFLHWDEVSLIENHIPMENKTDALGRTNHILKKYPIHLLPQKIFEFPKVKEFLLPNTLQHIYQNPEFGENWFSYPNLYKSIVEQFPSGSKFVEIGSWKGKSSAYMAIEIANSNKKIDFYCVDTWEGSIEHKNKEELNRLYDIFLRNMKPVDPYYFPLKIKSLEAASKFENNSLDFVFIDASHEYEDVKEDIIAWLPKVKSGGILAGHDYYLNEQFYCGVNRAVDELFENFETSEDCWIVRL